MRRESITERINRYLRDLFIFLAVLFIIVLILIGISIAGLFRPLSTKKETSQNQQDITALNNQITILQNQISQINQLINSSVCLNTTCTEVEFQGREGNIFAVGTVTILELQEIYDFQDGEEADNYDGITFIAPVSGIYHFDLDFSLNIAVQQEHFIIVTCIQMAPNFTVIESTFEVGSYTATILPWTMSFDMRMKGGNLLVTNIIHEGDNNIHLISVNFDGHLVTERIPPIINNVNNFDELLKHVSSPQILDFIVNQIKQHYSLDG